MPDLKTTEEERAATRMRLALKRENSLLARALDDLDTLEAECADLRAQNRAMMEVLADLRRLNEAEVERLRGVGQLCEKCGASHRPRQGAAVSACTHPNMVPSVVDQTLGAHCPDCYFSGECWDDHMSEAHWNLACKNDLSFNPCEQSRDNVCFLCGETFDPNKEPDE
jgi:hypothetical protein